jgi:hypothetical protein
LEEGEQDAVAWSPEKLVKMQRKVGTAEANRIGSERSMIPYQSKEIERI